VRYIVKIIAVDDGKEESRPYWTGRDDLAPAVHAIRTVPFAPGEPLQAIGSPSDWRVSRP
jgi:hypothetical protein